MIAIDLREGRGGDRVNRRFVGTSTDDIVDVSDTGIITVVSLRLLSDPSTSTSSFVDDDD